MSRRFKLTAPEPSEDELQASIADLLNAILIPGQAEWVHVPAGGYALSPAASARLYRLGLRAGWPDLLVCYAPCRSLWLEVKAVGGVTSKVQKLKHEGLRRVGHPVVIVRSIGDVLAALEAHEVPFRRARVAEGYYGRATQGISGASASKSQERPKTTAEIAVGEQQCRLGNISKGKIPGSRSIAQRGADAKQQKGLAV